MMLAIIRDDTWNVLNMHIIPTSKRWDYSDILSGGHKSIEGLTHIVEGGHHIRKAPNPHPQIKYRYWFVDKWNWNGTYNYISISDVKVHWQHIGTIVKVCVNQTLFWKKKTSVAFSSLDLIFNINHTTGWGMLYPPTNMDSMTTIWKACQGQWNTLQNLLPSYLFSNTII